MVALQLTVSSENGLLMKKNRQHFDKPSSFTYYHGAGAVTKLNHAKIRQAVIDVLSIRNAIKYEDFKEQVAKQYDVLTGQNIVNRND